MAIYDAEKLVEPVLCVEYFESCVSLGCLVELSCFAAVINRKKNTIVETGWSQVRYKVLSDLLQIDCTDRLGWIGSTVLSISVKSRSYSEIVELNLYLFRYPLI